MAAVGAEWTPRVPYLDPPCPRDGVIITCWSTCLSLSHSLSVLLCTISWPRRLQSEVIIPCWGIICYPQCGRNSLEMPASCRQTSGFILLAGSRMHLPGWSPTQAAAESFAKYTGSLILPVRESSVSVYPVTRGLGSMHRHIHALPPLSLSLSLLSSSLLLSPSPSLQERT